MSLFTFTLNECCNVWACSHWPVCRSIVCFGHGLSFNTVHVLVYSMYSDSICLKYSLSKFTVITYACTCARGKLTSCVQLSSVATNNVIAWSRVPVACPEGCSGCSSTPWPPSSVHYYNNATCQLAWSNVHSGQSIVSITANSSVVLMLTWVSFQQAE